VPDDACEADRLSNVLDRLLADPDHLKSMGEAAASVGRPDAADAGAAVVERYARTGHAAAVGGGDVPTRNGTRMSS
jgi:UDP-N-acetylglucosamine:LPS N-acetylglucosamine transferase